MLGRRRPPLSPLPLPLPRCTRFSLSRPHPVQLRMRERGRQIRRSAPMGNISKLKRRRSRVTPSHTCQTLTSSSKVEAASMSDKCKIRFDADPIQGASGGPGQVAQVSNVATHSGSSPRPPLDLLNCPDELKSLETDRLLPCDLNNANPTALRQYDAYLDWFYDSHRGPASAASLADTASMCLEKEDSMVSLWHTSCAYSYIYSNLLGDRILYSMQMVIEENGKVEHPFGIDAAECIAKEAELISEWLRSGRCRFTDDEYTLCHDIRSAAVVLLISRRKWSSHISAALLGIRKEAEWLIDNLKRNSCESISTSLKIRQFALDFLWKKYDELEPYEDKGSSESEIEMTSESDNESDDDVTSDSDNESDDEVTESQDNNNYVGGCHDEMYGGFGP